MAIRPRGEEALEELPLPVREHSLLATTMDVATVTA